ncbi:CHAP domain-containing protein [Candidatus Parcubacteria bacterium]|nr:CHAP domain-containing protein [Candidatus Parcubacteria bacterium]
MAKTQTQRHNQNKIIRLIVAVMVFFLLTPPVQLTPPVRADEFDGKINQLKSSISTSQNQIAELNRQQDTLQNKLAILNAQITASNAQIRLLSDNSRKVSGELEVQKRRLTEKKRFLAESLRTVYVRGQVTPLEVLASSSSFSEFIDRQQYLEKVKESIGQSIDAIQALQAKLQLQQQELAGLLEAQQLQRQSLASQSSEQANLLVQTQGLESNYQNLVANNKKQLQGIYAERARRDAANNTRVNTGGTGGYPWAAGPRCEVEGCVDDGYSFYQRQCTSYAAWWRRSRAKTPYPYGWGHAYQWDDGRSSSPVPVYGAVAVWNAYTGGAEWAGHVAIVEKVNGDGTIDVSEYNWATPSGYSYRSGVPIKGLRFIH